MTLLQNISLGVSSHLQWTVSEKDCFGTYFLSIGEDIENNIFQLSTALLYLYLPLFCTFVELEGTISLYGRKGATA